MQAKSVALLAAAGMLLTSVTVYSLTPEGGITASEVRDARSDLGREVGGGDRNDPEAPSASRFAAGSTLFVEGRLGHERIARSSTGETFVMLEVRGTEEGSAKPAPVNLSLVIDRSGSMRGTRLANALKAATGAVARLSDGDGVSVVTFDTSTTVVVPPTIIGPDTRDRVAAGIRGITLGGDTCLSCGIEEGMAALDRTSGRVNKMIVLSDGDANNGVRDVAGFRNIAQRARERGTGVTTIGVGVDYNEKVLSAISQESNGRHYFVEDDASLDRVFAQEAASSTTSVASDAEVAVALGPGVEIERVFDRSFRRSGNDVVVPLGTFARGEVKTVLLKVRVPNRIEGAVTVADVSLRYRDLVTDGPGTCGGKLAALVTDDASRASDLDPVVEGRVQRSETASTLKEANVLFEQGKVADARRRLETQSTALAGAADKASRAAPSPKAKAVNDDFNSQRAALEEASNGFASPPPAAASPSPAAPQQQTQAGKGAVRKNEERAFDLAF